MKISRFYPFVLTAAYELGCERVAQIFTVEPKTTMQSITLHSHVGSDGILQLQLPIDLKDTDLEVTVTIRPIAPKLDRNLGVDLGWSEGFFAETFGALGDDDSFIRHPQGDYEVREPL